MSDPALQARVTQRLSSIKHVVLVLSGKGGVGKSSVCVSMAQALVRQGKKVGVLDVDLCGPSIPRMLGLEGKSVHQSTDGWVPVYLHDQQLAVVSLGFLLGGKDEAVVWRGPKKTAMIQQFIADVCWGDLDYLLVDTPPGTSDEHLAVVEIFKEQKPDGAVLVTTPQGVSLSDVRREITFCHTVGLPIIGLVENMSGFVCPHCSDCSAVFSQGGGQRLAEATNVPFLGSIPLDPSLGLSIDQGASILDSDTESPTVSAILSVSKPLLDLPPRATSAAPPN